MRASMPLAATHCRHFYKRHVAVHVVFLVAFDVLDDPVCTFIERILGLLVYFNKYTPLRMVQFSTCTN
jgi:hypothetical protein